MASSVCLNPFTLWITGGEGKNSTEFISLDQAPVQGPDLPIKIHSHSMVLVDSQTIYIIGGSQNNKASKKLGS